MATADSNPRLAVVGGVVLFFAGLFSVMWLIDAGVQSVVLGESVWLGGGR